uniref:Uncharacterized protein n=1 Tax=Fagus sylvatica TaxID=28930 RepID=A0A2N9HMA6_FAGSY
MPVQKRSIDIGTVLGTSVPQSSETSSLPPPPGFSQGEGVMRRKRNRKEGEDEEDEGGRESSPAEPLKKKPSSKKGKGKPAPRSSKGHRWPTQVGKALLLPQDMKVWQEKRSRHMLENLKRDSVLAVQGIFEASSRLLETERRLQQSQEEVKRLKEFEKSASAKIRAAESAHKSAEAGLVNMERQPRLRRKFRRLRKRLSLTMIKALLRPPTLYSHSSKVKCNKFFIQGWHRALDRAGVDDASELYDLAPKNRPSGDLVSEERDRGGRRRMPLRTRRSLGPMKS